MKYERGLFLFIKTIPKRRAASISGSIDTAENRRVAPEPIMGMVTLSNKVRVPSEKQATLSIYPSRKEDARK